MLQFQIGGQPGSGNRERLAIMRNCNHIDRNVQYSFTSGNYFVQQFSSAIDYITNDVLTSVANDRFARKMIALKNYEPKMKRAE